MKANVSNPLSVLGEILSKSRVTLAKIEMIKMGIVPAVTGNQLTKMLDSMTAEERRYANRKFRKIWRNFAKKDKQAAEFMGLGNSTPTKDQKRNRSVIIAVEMVKNLSQ